MSKPIKKRNLFKSLFIASSVLLIGATAGIPITYYLVPQKNSGGDTPLPEKASLEFITPFLSMVSKTKIADLLGLNSTKKYEIKYFFNYSDTDYDSTNGGTFAILKNNLELWYTPNDVMFSDSVSQEIKIEIFEEGKTEAILTDNSTRYLTSDSFYPSVKFTDLDKVNVDSRTLVAATTGHWGAPIHIIFHAFLVIYGDDSKIIVTWEYHTPDEDRDAYVYMQLKEPLVSPIMGYLVFDDGDGFRMISYLVTIE